MLTLPEIESTLNEYVERIVPAMLRRGYHLILVKGGPDYPHLSEQSHFTHIINGIFGFARLARFMMERSVSIPGLNEETFRKTLALFTVHEVHKDTAVELLGESQFSIPLERVPMASLNPLRKMAAATELRATVFFFFTSMGGFWFH